jgi:hypothetical protein
MVRVGVDRDGGGWRRRRGLTESPRGETLWRVREFGAYDIGDRL